MNPIYYTVTNINGDYAYLTQIDTKQTIMIALALLPMDIMVGNKLKCEMMQYEKIDD